MPTIIAGAFPHMPIVDTSALSQRWGLKQVGLTISSLLYDSARQALYVGCFSHDTFRRNLLYFPIGENGVPFEPLVFPDHPVPLPENAATSRVWSLCLSHRKDMLYLGLVVELDVNSKKPVDKSVLKPVVVYDLDPKGVPVYSAKSPRSYGVKPQFFSQALALHPSKPRLYTIGRGLWSLAVFSLDPHSGEPIDNPRFAEIPFGGTCLGFMDDSRTLAISGYASYSGPSALVTVRLDDQGNPSSDAGDLRIHPLPAADTVDVVTGGATGFASLAIGPKAVYYKRIDGGLGYCLQNLNGTFSDYTINYERKIQAVSGPYEAQASSGPSAVNSLLVAAEHNFIDAVDGTKRPDGFVVARLSLDQKGVPGNFPEAVDVKFRQRCTLLSAIPSPAIVVSPMDVFLGNTVSDLWIQFSITPPAGDKGLQAQPELAEAAVTLKVAGRVAWETGRQNKLKIDGTLSKLVELDPYLQGRSGIALAYCRAVLKS